jgi:Peptidase family M28
MTVKRKRGVITTALVLLVIIIAVGFPAIQSKIASQATCIPSPSPTFPPEEPIFDGQRAYQDIATQLSFGPRYPGSDGHKATIKWITNELEENCWEVTRQTLEIDGHTVHNLIAHHGEPEPAVIFGAHYDTRLWADEDPDPAQQGQPVPGANDGGSGVAVLLELSRTIPSDTQTGTWLVFFDAEDQGRIAGWNWILGSTAFVENLKSMPQAVIIVDMIGDKDLNIHREKNSDPVLSEQIWSQAAELGYADVFINETKYSILDDHTPFLNAGIPAVDLIDFDYPAWHTINDDIEQVSSVSLQVVGDTLLAWLLSRTK